jgi:hypothetical protein
VDAAGMAAMERVVDMAALAQVAIRSLFGAMRPTTLPTCFA